MHYFAIISLQFENSVHFTIMMHTAWFVNCINVSGSTSSTKVLALSAHVQFDEQAVGEGTSFSNKHFNALQDLAFSYQMLHYVCVYLVCYFVVLMQYLCVL
jgi:hypothetical protein